MAGSCPAKNCNSGECDNDGCCIELGSLPMSTYHVQVYDHNSDHTNANINEMCYRVGHYTWMPPH